MKTQANSPLLRYVAELSILLLLLTTAVGPTPAKATSAPAVYTYDFEGSVGGEWSPAQTSGTPTGRRFLGEFGAEQATLTLNNLPPHLAVTLSFDFYAIRSWDGNQEQNEEGEPVGPDRFAVSVTDGPTLLDTTFANGDDAVQAYPGAYPDAAYPAHSGASEINTLGYTFFEDAVPFDAVYKLHFTFQHSGPSLQVEFSGIGLQERDDEAWGLDNVVVRLTEQATVYTDDFESATATPWTPAREDITPSGQRFLGEFGAEQVTLTLPDLPAHTAVTLTFDLYLIRTWDGNIDPDIFDVTVNGGPTLLHTTFTNNTGVNYQPQAYPGAYPDAANPPYTGASTIGALGYLPPEEPAQDAVYRLRFTFTHNSPVLQVTFAGIGLQQIEDESWGLDNVIVSLDGDVTYADTFDGTGWPTTRTDVTPSGRHFLGQFGAETVTLPLNNLPPHTELTLTFDFYAIETWDGNDDYWGPDIFDLRVAGGPTLLHTTFANAELPQAYPGSYPEASNPRYTGASEVNTLGYPTDGGWWGDAVYRLTFTFAHTNSSVQFSFSGIGLQELTDESWGLDNVTVHADAQEIYTNDFETAAPSAWSKTVLDITPAGRGFLGQWGAETVSLTLDDLPAHSYITLAFDFYAIQTWDGNQEVNQWGTPVGPDLFDLSVADGPTLLHTTFSNTENGGLPDGQQGPYLQAYPGVYPGASNVPGSGASEIDTLGYWWDGDAVYKLSFTFAHTSSDLQINFAVIGTDDSESWGLDNVKVIVSTSAPQLFVSSQSSARAGNVAFRDEDILAYDFSTATWTMVFDGSDVGVTKDVDAFAFRNDGALFLSFNAPTAVSGLGMVDDADIILFTPTRLGNDTAGSFTWLLHGADVGLTSDGEDIDAIGFTTDGHLVVSTIGDFTTPTASGRDEDLFRLDNATFGTPSSGVWQLFFDGSQAGLANEDVNGLWIDNATGALYLTVKDSFAFNNVPIDADDIFVCTPRQGGACTYQLFWDSDARNFGAENLDSIGLGPLPATFMASGQAHSQEAVTAEEAIADDDSDDLDPEDLTLEEAANHLFLPLVER